MAGSGDGPEPEVSEDGSTLTFTGLDPIPANDGASDGQLSLTFKLKAVAAGEGIVPVGPGETVSGLDVLSSEALP